MSDFREEEKLGKLYDTRLTRRLMKYLRPYRWQVAFAVAMSLAVAAMEIVGPFLFGRGVDRYIMPAMRGEIERAAQRSTGLWCDCAGLPRVARWRALRSSTCRCASCSGLDRRQCTTCARRFSSTLQRLPMSFFDRSPVGRLVTRVYHGRGRSERPVCHGRCRNAERFCSAVRAGCCFDRWHPVPRPCDAFSAARS